MEHYPGKKLYIFDSGGFITEGVHTVEVRAENISKKYAEAYAVKNASIVAKDKTLVCLLGPSGSGKSTLLRIIAGLIKPDEGRVFFDDRDVTDVPPWERNVGLVLQNIGLFPHMNVYDNIAFGLKIRGYPREEIDKRVKEMLKLVRLEGYEKRKPSQLSGGEAQRIAIARALAVDPTVLLFDEPLGHLDVRLRDEIKFEIRRIQLEAGKTAIYVTHDQSEAFAIADYIYVIRRGVIEQGGTPYELYENPRSPFVAEFIGSSNFIEGRVSSIQGTQAKIDIGVSEISGALGADIREKTAVIVAVKPGDIKVSTKPEEISEQVNVLEGTLKGKVYVGSYLRLEVDIGLPRMIMVDVFGEEKYKFVDVPLGARVYIGFSRASIFEKK